MNRILLIFCWCFSNLLFSQTNEEIASVYMKRAEKSFKEKDTYQAIMSYNKVLKYIDINTSSDISVPKFGMVLFAKANKYSEAKACSKDYFRLVSDKTTDEYLNMLELYVDIVDKLEDQVIDSTQVKEPANDVDNSNHYNFDNIVKSIKKKKKQNP